MGRLLGVDFENDVSFLEPQAPPRMANKTAPLPP